MDIKKKPVKDKLDEVARKAMTETTMGMDRTVEPIKRYTSTLTPMFKEVVVPDDPLDVDKKRFIKRFKQFQD